MSINIEQKYIINVDKKYSGDNREQFRKDYTPKEQSMWFFTLMLLKKDPNRKIYDSENDEDNKWLTLSLNIISQMPEMEKFTIIEWFDFLSKQPNI